MEIGMEEMIAKIKELALMVSHKYESAIKMEVNINRESDSVKINVTEYNI